MDAVDLKLRRPPVRSVRLALYLHSDEPLTGAHIDGLRSVWRLDYPSSLELPPLPSEGDTNTRADEDFGWPLPFIVFESPDDGRRIIFQADRLAIAWEFGDDGLDYPGFFTLRRELVTRFEQLTTNLELNQYTGNLQCQSVEVLYVNEVGPQPTLRVLHAQGVPSAEGRTYDTFTRHYHWDEDAAGWVSYSDSPDGAELRIRQQRELPDADAMNHWQALDECHERVIEAFIQWTSEEMRREWH